jgi:hypothetical protein
MRLSLLVVRDVELDVLPVRLKELPDVLGNVLGAHLVLLLRDNAANGDETDVHLATIDLGERLNQFALGSFGHGQGEELGEGFGGQERVTHDEGGPCTTLRFSQLYLLWEQLAGRVVQRHGVDLQLVLHIVGGLVQERRGSYPRRVEVDRLRGAED